MTIENAFSGSNDVLCIAGAGVQEHSIRGARPVAALIADLRGHGLIA
jgi:hypothetical protein